MRPLLQNPLTMRMMHPFLTGVPLQTDLFLKERTLYSDNESFVDPRDDGSIEPFETEKEIDTFIGSILTHASNAPLI